MSCGDAFFCPTVERTGDLFDAIAADFQDLTGSAARRSAIEARAGLGSALGTAANIATIGLGGLTAANALGGLLNGREVAEEINDIVARHQANHESADDIVARQDGVGAALGEFFGNLFNNRRDELATRQDGVGAALGELLGNLFNNRRDGLAARQDLAAILTQAFPPESFAGVAPAFEEAASAAGAIRRDTVDEIIARQNGVGAALGEFFGNLFNNRRDGIVARQDGILAALEKAGILPHIARNEIAARQDGILAALEKAGILPHIARNEPAARQDLDLGAILTQAFPPESLSGLTPAFEDAASAAGAIRRHHAITGRDLVQELELVARQKGGSALGTAASIAGLGLATNGIINTLFGQRDVQLD